MTTKITPSVLENTSVVAATHGNGATIPVIVVDPQGRITGVTNTSIGIATSQVTSGTLADARLPDTGAAAGSYGSASRVPRIIVDAKGRATGVANIDIQIATSQITGYPTFASSATTDTTNASNISSGTLPDARLSNAGVNTGTFGSASVVPRIAVDSKGRVTGVTATSIAIGSGAVSGLAASATTNTTDAGNISSGTLPDARLSNAGTNVGTFGTASAVPRIAVDSKGRVTSVTSTNIGISAGSVSGLATVATSGAYGDLSGRPTIPTNTNQLTNGAGFITSAPTNTNQLTNGAGFITAASLPTDTNQLTNGAGFITAASLPTNLNQLTNGPGYVTSSSALSGNWTDVTSSRFRGTTYTNSTGKPIMVNITAFLFQGQYWFILVNDLLAARAAQAHGDLSVIVPNGATYLLQCFGGSLTPSSWTEFS